MVKDDLETILYLSAWVQIVQHGLPRQMVLLAHGLPLRTLCQ